MITGHTVAALKPFWGATSTANDSGTLSCFYAPPHAQRKQGCARGWPWPRVVEIGPKSPNHKIGIVGGELAEVRNVGRPQHLAPPSQRDVTHQHGVGAIVCVGLHGGVEEGAG